MDIASLDLVATPAASTSGELLAWSALRFWQLTVAEHVVPRMRALINAAVAATAPLHRLDVRLVLLERALILEIVFPEAAPSHFDEDLVPSDAHWTWHRNYLGLWCLRDELNLRDRQITHWE